MPASRLPGIFLEGADLCAVQRRIDLRWAVPIYLIKAFRNRIGALPFEELRNRRGVQLAPRHAKSARRDFRLAE